MNSFRNLALATLTTVFTFFAISASTLADPLPGRDVLKFSQQPMDNLTLTGGGVTQTFWGHDELSTAYSVPNTAGGLGPYQGTFMADDFADKFASPVVHVKWWGSYLDNGINPNIPVNKFLISFETDVPASAGHNFSHPGQPIINQIVRRGPLAPGSGTFTETPVSPGGPPLNERLFEYNAELHLGKDFKQLPDTVYWLKIVALVDLPPGIVIPNPDQPPAFVPRWGWHNRDYTVMNPLASTAPAVVPGEHIDGFLGPAPGGIPVWHFQDDAVTGRVFVDTAGPMGQIMPVILQTNYQPRNYLPGADGPPPIAQFSKDLAFELYTVPEPAACGLMLVAAVIAIAYRRQSPRS
jgi:hypothetical protein